ncbi:MAG: hypothetical protein V8S95_02165 [Odoribacter sp.]
MFLKTVENRLDRMPGGWLACDVEQSGGGPVYAALLLWWLDGYSFVGNQQTALQGMLQLLWLVAVKRRYGSCVACWLVVWRTGGRFSENFGRTENIGFRFSEADFLALWILLLDYRRKEVADFRNRKEEWKLLIFSPSHTESRTFRQKLWAMADGPGTGGFSDGNFGGGGAERCSAAEGMDRECLWACLSAGR